MHEIYGFMRAVATGLRREDAAASIQQVLEYTMLLSITRLLQRHPTRHLGLVGSVFANVRLNRLLVERLPIDEIFIYPAMGDEGVPAGGVLCYLLRRDGLAHWLGQRRRLRDVYFSRPNIPARPPAGASGGVSRATYFRDGFAAGRSVTVPNHRW